jgi:uncharacterized membrane protein
VNAYEILGRAIVGVSVMIFLGGVIVIAFERWWQVYRNIKGAYHLREAMKLYYASKKDSIK